MAKIIQSHEFDAAINAEQQPVLIDVFTPDCVPCKVMAPIIDALAEELKGKATVVKVNSAEAAKNGGEDPLIRFMNMNGIHGVPAFLLFENGEFKDVLLGGPRTRKQIRGWMEEKLGHALGEAPGVKAEAPAAKTETLSSPAASEAGPELQTYGIILKAAPKDEADAYAITEGLLAASQMALKPFYATDEAQDRAAMGPLADQSGRFAFIFDATPRAAQAVANFLPDYEVIDTDGNRVTPAPKQALAAKLPSLTKTLPGL